jgi:hypothetical protein
MTAFPSSVIPAKAGIQTRYRRGSTIGVTVMDSRLRGNDGCGWGKAA